MSTARKIFLPLEYDGEVIAQVKAVHLYEGQPGVLRLADVKDAAEQGNAGITGYYGATGGLPDNKDYNPEYKPALARGSYRNHGLYHQAYLENPSYQRAVRNIIEGLTTGYWSVEPYDDSAESKFIADGTARVLFGLDGGWERHVEEALYCLITGFAPFLKIVDGWGQLRRLDFRFSHTLSKWITDEHQNSLLAAEFTSQGAVKSYVVPVNQLVLYQIGALGNDFEGVSPMRSVYKYIQANQLFSQLEALAAEKYGGPIAWVKRGADAAADSKDDAVLEGILDQMVAADNPIIVLPNGYEIVVSSPQGQMPNFDIPKRYCDEQITRILQADGALVGLNGAGAYSLAEVKDDQQIRSLWYYASLICRVVNGEGARPYTGVIRHIVDALVGDLTYRGRYPKLRWSLSPAQDDGLQIDQIAAAHQAGIIDLDEEDKALIRAKLGLPKRKQVIA